MIDPETREESLLYESGIPAEELPHVWSPDRKYIAFLDTYVEEHNLKVMNVDAREQLGIGTVSGDKRAVSWSPDSRAVIFSNFDDSTAAMYVLDIKSGELTEVMESEPGASLGDSHWSN